MVSLLEIYLHTADELLLHTDNKALLILHGLLMSVSFPLLPSDICPVLSRTSNFGLSVSGVSPSIRMACAYIAAAKMC